MNRATGRSLVTCCCSILFAAISLSAVGQPTTDSPEIDALLTTLATGSDEAATAALLQLDTEPERLLPHYEQIADAVLNATGSLEKKKLTALLEWRYSERTPFDKLFQNRTGDRKELLVFWMAERIRTLAHSDRKEEILKHFMGIVDRLLAADNITPETTCNLLSSFRLSIFYPFPIYIIPIDGADLALELYLRHLESPTEAVSKEIFAGLCRMGFCYPSRQEEIRKVLIETYPEHAEYLKRPGASMSFSLPQYDAPITEEEYLTLRAMDGVQLTDVLRSQVFPLAGNAKETIILAILFERVQKGDEPTYEALFTLGEEVSNLVFGLDAVTATLGRGAARFITDEEKADAFLQFLATRTQRSAKKFEAIEVAAAVLHEAFIAPLPGSPSYAPPIPGTAHAVQALEALAQQSTNQGQKDRIESHVTKIQEIKTRYDNEMKKRQQRGNTVSQPSRASSQ